MRASVSQEEWNKLLAAVVTGISTSLIPRPVSLQDEPSVENLSYLAKNTSIVSTCVTPNHALVIPQNAINWKICLEAGQHRQAALHALNQEQDTLAKTDKGRKAGIEQSTSEDYLWPVSLYLRDKLDAESLTALRANRDKVSKSDANGDLLVRVLYLLNQKSMADRAALLRGQKKMKVWLAQAHGASTSNTARLLNILRSDLCASIAQYCRTRYGASHFTITWGSNVVLGSLDFIWDELLRNFVTNSEAVFGKRWQMVTSSDLERIMVIGTNNLTNLILLFFPTPADYENGVLTGKGLQIPTSIAASITAQTWPEMPPLVYKNNPYNRRRPGFLENLTDSEYTHAFIYIATEQPTFDSWKRWGTLQNNMTIVTGIISHLLVWFDADWVFPEKAAKERQSFQWDTIVRDVILRQSTLVEGGKRGFEETADDLEVARSLIWKIWDAVDSDKIWKDAVVRKEVGNPFSSELPSLY
ncbi:hypothetical protein BDW67DRAFT_189640 [Aspergillus spinulosporus]